MIDATFRPIDQWPGELTSDDARQQSRFKASYTDTLNLLDRELWELNGRNIVIQLALELRDIRYDGWPRASASPQHPGVIVAFDSIHGPLKYATDAFKGNGYGGWLPGWQANLRAVALGLEALRKVDRYGITKRGEQYTGWSALPPGTIAAGAAAMTGEQAAQYIDNACGGLYAREHILRNHETRVAAYRAAAKVLHPDVDGGDTEKFKRLQEAMRVLGGDVVSARQSDEHGRPIFAANEVPPIAVGLAVWQGNVTATFPPYPGNQVSGCHPSDLARKPYATCTHGWVRSGDWWLHCADCHPAPDPRCDQHPTYPEPCAICAMNRVPS